MSFKNIQKFSVLKPNLRRILCNNDGQIPLYNDAKYNLLNFDKASIPKIQLCRSKSAPLLPKVCFTISNTPITIPNIAPKVQNLPRFADTQEKPAAKKNLSYSTNVQEHPRSILDGQKQNYSTVTFKVPSRYPKTIQIKYLSFKKSVYNFFRKKEKGTLDPPCTPKVKCRIVDDITCPGKTVFECKTVSVRKSERKTKMTCPAVSHSRNLQDQPKTKQKPSPCPFPCENENEVTTVSNEPEICCPEPPKANDSMSMPYYYKKVCVKTDCGKCIKYEMQRCRASLKCTPSPKPRKRGGPCGSLQFTPCKGGPCEKSPRSTKDPFKKDSSAALTSNISPIILPCKIEELCEKVPCEGSKSSPKLPSLSCQKGEVPKTKSCSTIPSSLCKEHDLCTKDPCEASRSKSCCTIYQPLCKTKDPYNAIKSCPVPPSSSCKNVDLCENDPCEASKPKSSSPCKKVDSCEAPKLKPCPIIPQPPCKTKDTVNKGTCKVSKSCLASSLSPHEKVDTCEASKPCNTKDPFKKNSPSSSKLGPAPFSSVYKKVNPHERDPCEASNPKKPCTTTSQPPCKTKDPCKASKSCLAPPSPPCKKRVDPCENKPCGAMTESSTAIPQPSCKTKDQCKNDQYKASKLRPAPPSSPCKKVYPCDKDPYEAPNLESCTATSQPPCNMKDLGKKDQCKASKSNLIPPSSSCEVSTSKSYTDTPQSPCKTKDPWNKDPCKASKCKKMFPGEKNPCETSSPKSCTATSQPPCKTKDPLKKNPCKASKSCPMPPSSSCKNVDLWENDQCEASEPKSCADILQSHCKTKDPYKASKSLLAPPSSQCKKVDPCEASKLKPCSTTPQPPCKIKDTCEKGTSPSLPYKKVNPYEKDLSEASKPNSFYNTSPPPLKMTISSREDLRKKNQKLNPLEVLRYVVKKKAYVVKMKTIAMQKKKKLQTGEKPPCERPKSCPPIPAPEPVVCKPPRTCPKFGFKPSSPCIKFEPICETNTNVCHEASDEVVNYSEYENKPRTKKLKSLKSKYPKECALERRSKRLRYGGPGINKLILGGKSHFSTYRINQAVRDPRKCEKIIDPCHKIEYKDPFAGESKKDPIKEENEIKEPFEKDVLIVGSCKKNIGGYFSKLGPKSLKVKSKICELRRCQKRKDIFKKKPLEKISCRCIRPDPGQKKVAKCTVSCSEPVGQPPIKAESCGKCNRFQVYKDPKSKAKPIKCAKPLGQESKIRPPDCFKPRPKRKNVCSTCPKRWNVATCDACTEKKPLIKAKNYRKATMTGATCTAEGCKLKKKKEAKKHKKTKPVSCKKESLHEICITPIPKEEKIEKHEPKGQDCLMHTSWTAVSIKGDSDYKFNKRVEGVNEKKCGSVPGFGKELPEMKGHPRGFLNSLKGLLQSISAAILPSKDNKGGKQNTAGMVNSVTDLEYRRSCEEVGFQLPAAAGQGNRRSDNAVSFRITEVAKGTKKSSGENRNTNVTWVDRSIPDSILKSNPRQPRPIKRDL